MKIKSAWRRTMDWWTVRKLGVLALLLAIFIGVVGYLNQHDRLYLGEELGLILKDFYTNVSTDLASIALTVLVIDYLIERGAEKQLKAQLIRELRNPDKGTTFRAVEELRAHRWLADGSLRKAYLYQANLEGVNLRGADLQDSNLWGANLRDTILTSANLRRTHMGGVNLEGASVDDQELIQPDELLGATMQDGSRYDGRFNLWGDLEFASSKRISIDDPKAMAMFYDTDYLADSPVSRNEITIEVYQRGQQWARVNLPKLRSK